jgi:uncharacterized pyridoxamine 5'-phosphate oxidase family protein
LLAFVGKGGANIKQLSSDHDVEIEKMKKHQNTIRITGKEEEGKTYYSLLTVLLL